MVRRLRSRMILVLKSKSKLHKKDKVKPVKPAATVDKKKFKKLKLKLKRELKLAGNFCYCKRNQSLKSNGAYRTKRSKCFPFHSSKKYSKKHKRE